MKLKELTKNQLNEYILKKCMLVQGLDLSYCATCKYRNKNNACYLARNQYLYEDFSDIENMEVEE